MPLQIVHDHRPIGGGLLALWQLDEPEEWLVQRLKDCWPERIDASHLKTTQRRREWMASQLLMHDCQISLPTYLPNGKPVLEQGGISISHSDRLVGLAVGPGSIGLDIQKCVEKIFTVRSKFCSPEELVWAESRVDALRTLTIIWSAKEAIFKYWGEHVDFAREIAISPFACSDLKIDASYRGRHGQKLFRLQHLTLVDYEVVVCSDGLNTQWFAHQE